jgi:hypothetical protein
LGTASNNGQISPAQLAKLFKTSQGLIEVPIHLILYIGGLYDFYYYGTPDNGIDLSLINGISNKDGVDLLSNKLLSNKFEKYKFSLVTSSIDDFLDNNIETFDVVLLGVIIHGTGDIIELFRKISKITNRVVVETAHPFYLTYKSNSNLLSTDDLYNLEYKTAVVELHEDPTSKHVNFLHSMKYLSTIFNRLGFVENYKPYEQLKKELPNIYGFNLNSRLGLAKRYILIFNKTPSQEQTPIVWEENFEKF